MKTIAVTHIPETYTAVQFDGEIDIDLAYWCKGRYEPNTKERGWVLQLSVNQLVYPGQWIMRDIHDHFFKVTNEVYEKEFIRKEPL